MIITVKILLFLIALGMIIWPFVRKGENGEVMELVPQEHLLENLVSQKEHTYAAIKELDFDYNMGKLSEEDYQELKKQYKQKAVDILKQIDELSGSTKVARKASA